MPAFKSPDFNDRTAVARAAKQRALDLLRDKPAPDPALVAARQEARAAREQAELDRRAARKAAAAEAKNLAEQAKADALEAAKRPVPTEAEMKAERDARYASRKARRR